MSPARRDGDIVFTLAVCAEMVYLDLPFEERITRIAERGFEVEMWGWQDHDVAAIVATGVPIASMTGYVEGSLDSPEWADRLVATAEETIAVAATLGCRRLVIHGTELREGHAVRPVETVTPDMWLTAYKTLERLAVLAERAGVTFCLENLNLALDHPGVPFARAADTLALVSAVDHPNIRMMLDLYHAQIDEGNLVDLVRRADRFIGEIQVADVPGRCEPGSGEIHYPAIARALREIDYTGTVGMEGYASGDTDAALERFRAAFAL